MLEYVLLGMVCLFCGYMGIALQIERRRSIRREQELLAAVLAQNIEQYIGAIERLRRYPKDTLSELKIENELAQAAVKLEGPLGTPVR